MGVNSLPKTVTRQRRTCDCWTQALLRMSPAWVRYLVYNTGLVQYRWTGLDLLTADRLKMQDWGIVNSSKYSLSCLRFPPFQIRTCVFRTCIFHPCILVLTYSVLAYSFLRYFRFRYLCFQSPQLAAGRSVNHEDAKRRRTAGSSTIENGPITRPTVSLAPLRSSDVIWKHSRAIRSFLVQNVG